MNCSNHGEREAVGMCVRCRKLICEECKVKINNKYYCKNCVSEMYSDNNSNNSYNNRNNNYSYGSTINSDKVKEYADKAVNATVDITNNTLNIFIVIALSIIYVIVLILAIREVLSLNLFTASILFAILSSSLIPNIKARFEQAKNFVKRKFKK